MSPRILNYCFKNSGPRDFFNSLGYKRLSQGAFSDGEIGVVSRRSAQLTGATSIAPRRVDPAFAMDGLAELRGAQSFTAKGVNAATHRIAYQVAGLSKRLAMSLRGVKDIPHRNRLPQRYFVVRPGHYFRLGQR